MSISQAHSAAARENGMKSAGPVTDQGKARSAQNARKHGLFASSLHRNPEEQAAYSELLEAYIEEYQPRSIYEHRCVREMVDAEWRLHSLRTTLFVIETDRSAAAPPKSTPAQARAVAFQKLANQENVLSVSLRYEKQFQRQFEKAHQALTAARRAENLDQETIARRTDEAMANILQSVVEAPIPDVPLPAQENIQNEPKPPAPNNQNIQFNPCIHTKAAPNFSIPNLFKG
ncbi:MAG: hypothetical protein JNL62_17305 [Bryobacterales bacterium]|nr:hypothetical protein [Bryobacterales bacterium]